MILTEQQNHVIYNDFNNGIKDLRIEHQFEHHEQQQQQEQQLMTPIIHSIKEFKLCDKCDLNENKEIIDYYEIIFNKCQYCKLKLFNDASVSEIFFIMRKWKSNIQKNMNIFIDLVREYKNIYHRFAPVCIHKLGEGNGCRRVSEYTSPFEHLPVLI